MRKSNRKIRMTAALLAALLAASALVGCGAKEEPDKNTENTEAPGNNQNQILPGDEEGTATANVGDFTAKDISGEEYTKDMFADYDLTLVNVFATWCSPCVNELPELEELKQEMAAKGIHVVAVVYDSVDVNGEINEDAVEKAQQLRERAGLTFPMLIPDETMMNGRLEGINGYPESFFVDKDGNIVGETYVGARSFDTWKAVVENELENLQ